MRRRHDIVLAVHPNVRGIAYTAFDGPLAPVGWGIKRITGSDKNLKSVEAVQQLVEQFQPDILVLEDCSGPGSRKSDRVRRLHRLILNYAEGESIETHAYARHAIRECFKAVGAKTRFEIAAAIAAMVHVFSNKMPKAKKIWMSEDNRLKLFDAASLVMTYYCQAKSLDEVAPAPDP